VISLENASADDFTEEEQQILEASAFQLGAVLKTELLLGELKRRDERIANFRRLVSRPVAARVLELDGRLRLSMQLCEVTVLFSDIRGFTRMAADMLPDDVTEMLEAYLSRLVPVIEQHGGAVDKFMGDGIMAVFASDTEDPDQPVHAVSAALGMLDAARVVSQERLRARQVIGELGIGIHRGRALQGFSGTRERMEFTAIGDVVNWASRISDGAGKSDLLVSKEVHERVWGKLRRTAAFERTTIPTKHEGDLVVYRVRPWVGQGGAAAGTETTAVPVVG
jgi:adenylate cyclase